MLSATARDGPGNGLSCDSSAWVRATPRAEVVPPPAPFSRALPSEAQLPHAGYGVAVRGNIECPCLRIAFSRNSRLAPLSPAAWILPWPRARKRSMGRCRNRGGEGMWTLMRLSTWASLRPSAHRRATARPVLAICLHSASRSGACGTGPTTVAPTSRSPVRKATIITASAGSTRRRFITRSSAGSPYASLYAQDGSCQRCKTLQRALSWSRSRSGS